MIKALTLVAASVISIFLSPSVAAAQPESPSVVIKLDSDPNIIYFQGIANEIAILDFCIASFSRQQVLEKCITNRTAARNLWKLDLRDVYWGQYEWQRFVAQFYPYAAQPHTTPFQRGRYTDYRQFTLPAYSPKIIRADWFISYVSDANDNSSGYALLYGFNGIPKTKAEFIKFWDINTKPEYQFGLIEGDSRVAKKRVRWIDNFSAPRGYAWGTKDFLQIDPTKGKDPLQYPLPNDTRLKPDGQEWIVGIPKFSSVTGKRSVLQVYGLFDAADKRIDKADGDLVEDHTHYKSFSQIRTHGSCIQCHTGGINEPTRNEFRSLLLSGQDAYASYDNKEALERFHLSDTAKEIKRNNEDYAEAIFTLSQQSPLQNAKLFKETVDSYNSTVNLERAARQLSVSPATLSSAIAFASNTDKNLGHNITGLPHGRKMNIETWEVEYYRVNKVLQQWLKVVGN